MTLLIAAMIPALTPVMDQKLMTLAAAIQQAMQRQDMRMEDLSKELVRTRDSTEGLLWEVLRSVQPDPERAIKERIGLPDGPSRPLPSFPSSIV